jgi:hypothetical protein
VRTPQPDLVMGDQRLVIPPQLPGAVVELATGAEAHAPRAAAEVLDAEPHGRDRDVVVALAGEDLELRGEVGVERAVAIEVVRCDVEQHRPFWRELDRVFELSSSPTSEVSGVPTFPANAAETPASRWISPSSPTVVVLPFVPVTAMNSLGSRRHANSTSPITGIPRSRAATITGASCGTPGDLITQRMPSSATGVSSPCLRSTPRAWSPSSFSSAWPERARPTTR